MAEPLSQPGGANYQTLFFLYEPSQVAEFARLSKEKSYALTGVLVIALDREIELLLEKAGIPFQSADRYHGDTSLEGYLLAEKWALRIFRSAAWAFFEYRQVSFTKIFFPSLLAYLQRSIYLVNLCASVVEAFPRITRIQTFPSSVVTSATTGYLARREADQAAECLEAVAKSKGCTFVLEPLSKVDTLRTAQKEVFAFRVKRALFTFLLSIWNLFIRFVRGSGAPRILVSDYWRNVEPVLWRLPGREVIFFEKKEALNAGLRNMWHYRIRFLNFKDFAVRTRRKEREEVQTLFRTKWQELQDSWSYLSDCTVRGVAFRSLIMGALSDMCSRTITHTIQEVDEAYALLESTRPNVILLRASISAQTHFSCLALVGSALRIPSIELQHGIEYDGPGSGGKRHTAEYIGVYGKPVQNELTALGFAREHLPIIGSPRFDVYAKKKLPTNTTSPGRFNILCIAPIATAGEYYDSYVLKRYFVALAAALRSLPQARLTIKLRAGPRREAFYRETIASACEGIPYVIVQNESLFTLFAQSDAVVSFYSTAALEALQCEKPVVAYSSLAYEVQMERFHFAPYVKAGALIVAENEVQLSTALARLADPSVREKMSRAASRFMKEHYAFDGRAGERSALLIKELSQVPLTVSQDKGTLTP